MMCRETTQDRRKTMPAKKKDPAQEPEKKPVRKTTRTRKKAGESVIETNTSPAKTVNGNAKPEMPPDHGLRNFLSLFTDDPEQIEQIASQPPMTKEEQEAIGLNTKTANNHVLFLLMLTTIRDSIISETGINPDEQGSEEKILSKLDRPEKFNLYKELLALADNPQKVSDSDVFDNLYVAFIKSISPDLDEDAIMHGDREEIVRHLPVMRSRIPEKHMIPNSKLINSLQSGELFNEAVDLVVLNKGKKSEITTAVKITYRKDGAYLPADYTEFDRSVMDAVLSQYEFSDTNGNIVFTPQLIYRTMTYKKDSETPSQKQIDAIITSIEKMRFMEVEIDATEEMKEWMKGQNMEFTDDVATKFSGYILPVNMVSVRHQGKTIKAYQMIHEPAIYSYAKARKQLLTCNAELLNIREIDAKSGNILSLAVPLSEKRIEISNYVLRRILIMQYDKKHHINRQSKTILLETIFKDVRLEGISRNQSMDYRKFIVKVLNYYKALNFIKDYTEQKEGKKITGFVIEL